MGSGYPGEVAGPSRQLVGVSGAGASAPLFAPPMLGPSTPVLVCLCTYGVLVLLLVRGPKTRNAAVMTDSNLPPV